MKRSACQGSSCCCRAAVRPAVGRRVLHGLALVPGTRLRRRVPAHAERAGASCSPRRSRRLLFLLTQSAARARGRSIRPQIVLGTGVDGRPIAIEGRRLAGARALAIAPRSRRSSRFAASRRLADVAQLLQGAPFGTRIRCSGATSRSTSSGCRSSRCSQREALVTMPRADRLRAATTCSRGSFVDRAALRAGAAGRASGSVPRRGATSRCSPRCSSSCWPGARGSRFPRRCSTPSIVVLGASYADVHARIPFSG